MNGTCCLLSGGNWFHFLNETIPAIYLLRKAGYNFSNINHFLLEDGSLPAMITSLGVYGIEKSKIVEVKSRYNNYQCEKLIVVTKHVRWSYQFSTSFKPLIENFYKEQEIKKSRVYVSRKMAPFRKVANENELIKLLYLFDFRVIYNETLTLQDQISIFHGADFIMGMHGANLANVAFCKQGTTLCEIVNEACLETQLYYWKFAQNLGLNYHVIFAKSWNNNYPVSSKNDDVLVDLNLLEEYLRKMLSK